MSDHGIRLERLSSSDPKIKFGTAKKLIELAKTHPESLYPAFDSIVPILDDQNNIIKWSAIDAIGYLACVDENHLVDSLLPKLCSYLRCGRMITANHAIAALGRIAAARPELQAEITAELLKVDRYRYDTKECNNIAVGKTLEAIASYSDEVKSSARIRSFARRQLKNTRNATKRKAEKLLRKLEEAGEVEL